MPNTRIDILSQAIAEEQDRILKRQELLETLSKPKESEASMKAQAFIAEPARFMNRQPLSILEVSKRQLEEQQQVAAPIEKASFRRPTALSIEQVREQKVAKARIEEPMELKFWQRALEVFAAPFEWVDKNIIVPGLSLLGTTAGFVSEVKRKPGEDFWDWKRRSWEGWKAPGIEMNVPWSDESMRIDMKGILELAPWLLIPGAGKVGGAPALGARLAGKAGVRVASGLGGFVGKAGLPGRVLGTAIEYSPWGLVEKTAGVAIKGGFRAVGNVGERVSTAVGKKLFGEYVPPPLPESITKLTNYFKQTVMPTRKAFKKEIPGLRSKQEQAVQKVFKAYRSGKFGIDVLPQRLKAATKGGLAPEFALTPEALATRQARDIAAVEARVVSGELSERVGKGLITRIRNNPAFTSTPFNQSEVKELHDMIINSIESGLVKFESGDAFLELMLSGKLPQPHHIRDWAKVFGDDFARTVGQLSSVSSDKLSQLIDTLNIGRSLQASLDLSGTGRQGLILSLLHPTKTPRWFGRQIQALMSEKWALEIDDVMRASPDFNEIMHFTGGYIAPIREATLTTAEEVFASRVARVVPGIRRSERAFVTYLNQARWTALKDGYYAMRAQGASPKQMELLGQFVDLASGRGRIPKSLEKFMPLLNAVLFSPRLQASTIDLPRQLGRMFLSGNPYMRKEAAKALTSFVGGGIGLLSLLNATGNKVETDPRSGDYGKIMVGETRLDIWRGYLQYARLAAQMLTGERKAAYGNMNKADRWELAQRFIQSKASPASGMLVDILKGETYMGAPIFNDTTGFSKAASDRILPLAMQDIIDAMQQNGINGLWVAAPATLGVGALTYVNDFVLVQRKIAQEEGYESWDDIDPKTQREIENRNAELQTAMIAFDRNMMGTAWGDWKLAGNAIEDNFKDNVEMAVAQYRQTGDGFSFNEKVTTAFTLRQGGYQAREKEDRFAEIVSRFNIPDVAESLIALGPEQLAIKTYNDALYGEEMYDEFGDYRFQEAEIMKEQLRQQLGPELFDYVQEYQGVKYEIFPQEFQELMEARKIMRDYWEVRSNVENMFGTRFAESSKGQSAISKLRKRLLASNREMARLHTLFYVRP